MSNLKNTNINLNNFTELKTEDLILKKISEKELYLISKNGIISDIASVNVIKGIEALKKYPEDGKKVVYEITLKNNSKPNF